MKTSIITQKGESKNGCFKKTNDMHTYMCASGGLEMFFFRKIWRALFSWNTRFKIRPLALLPTKRLIWADPLYTGPIYLSSQVQLSDVKFVTIAGHTFTPASSSKNVNVPNLNLNLTCI